MIEFLHTFRSYTKLNQSEPISNHFISDDLFSYNCTYRLDKIKNSKNRLTCFTYVMASQVYTKKIKIKCCYNFKYQYGIFWIRNLYKDIIVKFIIIILYHLYSKGPRKGLPIDVLGSDLRPRVEEFWFSPFLPLWIIESLEWS